MAIIPVPCAPNNCFLPKSSRIEQVTLVDCNGFPIEGLPVVIVGVTPGTTITSAADTAVPAGATVALPLPLAGTRRMTVQNTGPTGTFVRIREAGGLAGAGIILPRFGSIVYGGADGAIDTLEAEEITGTIATSVALQFERD